ncbi:hypothetical protein ACN9JG_04200 [Cereibacter azotoformans]|uniref:hypothetical protein n=1 Tax=Cereibacter azotoformans TaxID=43057 RepID=UPI003B21C7E9
MDEQYARGAPHLKQKTAETCYNKKPSAEAITLTQPVEDMSGERGRPNPAFCCRTSGAAASRIARGTRDDKKRIQQLERELARKEKALAEAAALMILRKKVEAIWDRREGEDE